MSEAHRKTLKEGDRFRTVCCAVTSPFPKTGKASLRNEKKVRQWLLENALSMARLTNNEFMRTTLSAVDVNNWAPADGDSLCLFLFGETDGAIAHLRCSPKSGDLLEHY